jgi:hypothetical protein
MAYGRLDVYWPDGRLETYMLEEDTISVGRAEGNTIALDTETISRYHFSIVKEEERILITDLASANGTYLDGIALAGNQPHELGEVEEIQVGSLRIIYRQVDHSPTVMMTAMEEDTVPVTDSLSLTRISLDATQLDVWPASNSSTTELSITNFSDETRRFTVQASGLPGEWMRIARPEVELEPEETAYVLISIKPPRRPNVTPDEYTVAVEVIPSDTPDKPLRTELKVTVHTYSGFGIALAPQIDADDPISIFLHNQGSAMLSIGMSAKSPTDALTFDLPARPVSLQPGQRLRVDMGVKAKNAPLIGSVDSQPFIIEARSYDASGFLAATGGKAKVAARYPLWGVVTVAGIALSIVIVGLLAVFGLLNAAPEPSISNLAVNVEEVAQGEQLTLSLEPLNLDSMDVLVNNTVALANLPGDQTSIALDTSDYEGTLEIDVLGYRGSETVEASTVASVYIPLRVVSFSVEPETLVRHTVNTLRLSWEVSGAETVRLSGLSDFTNQLFQSSTEYPSEHTLEGVAGVAQEPLRIVVRAEDERGNLLEESFFVDVIDPLCTVQSDLLLLEGPDVRYQPVGQARAGSSVIVTARDSDTGWLRVRLNGEVTGWGALDSFECADTFELADLRIETDVPELPPTPTPSPAPTASNTPQVPAPAVTQTEDS